MVESARPSLACCIGIGFASWRLKGGRFNDHPPRIAEQSPQLPTDHVGIVEAVVRLSCYCRHNAPLGVDGRGSARADSELRGKGDLRLAPGNARRGRA